MKIIVEAEKILAIIEAVKTLPVYGDFDGADQWVGCVIELQKMVNEGEEYIEPVEEVKEEELK